MKLFRVAATFVVLLTSSALAPRPFGLFAASNAVQDYADAREMLQT